jgi:protein TonB
VALLVALTLASGGVPVVEHPIVVAVVDDAGARGAAGDATSASGAATGAAAARDAAPAPEPERRDPPVAAPEPASRASRPRDAERRRDGRVAAKRAPASRPATFAADDATADADASMARDADAPTARDTDASPGAVAAAASGGDTRGAVGRDDGAGATGHGVAGAGRGAAGAGTGAGGDLRPWCAHCPTPEYPARARREGWQGTVDVDLHVGRDGAVEDASIGRSSGFAVLDAAAVTVARRSRFRVAEGSELHGQLRYRFVLEGALDRPL